MAEQIQYSEQTLTWEEVFRIHVDYMTDLFAEKDKIYNLHSTVSLKQPKCNTVTYGSNSFRYKGAKILNDLPYEIKNPITLAEFKNRIKTWQGP